MTVEERQIDGRNFWFTIERPYSPDPDTGELVEGSGYYVAFSLREPTMVAGEFVKDDRGRVKLFSTANEALEVGIKEVKARLGLPAKAFAVGLPGGTRDVEFRAYVSLLEENRIDSGKPRVEDSFGRKWLHVWENRGDAEKFASQLRRITRNPNWEVYDLVRPNPVVEAEAEDSGPIIVLVGRQTDGNTYDLHPNSVKALRKKFPRVPMKPSVFIGRETQANYEQSVGNAMYDQVLVLLTGLNVDRVLETFGGYSVVDPISNLTLWNQTKPVQN